MAQIQKKFIAANAVDGSKIRLANAEALRARNFADSGDIDILSVNASDTIIFSSLPQVTSDPSAANDLVRKSYVDSVIQGLKPKEAVRVATLVAGTLASDFEDGDVIDGITLATGDRILIKDQADPVENGIYVVQATGAPVRSTDFDSSSPIDEINGAYTMVREGTQAGQGWVVSDPVAAVNVDPINFVYFSSVGGLIGGDGIDITGSTISVDLSATPGLEFSSAQLQVKVDAAGAVLRGAGGLAVSLQASNPTLIIASNELGVKTFSGSALAASASGLGIVLEASNPSLQISSNELGIKLNAAGAITKGASGVQVNVDNSTIEINTNAIRVKDAGITAAKFNSNVVDGTTTKLNGSNQIEGLKPANAVITLNGTDITNQYVDLAFTAYSAANVEVCPVGGIKQENGIDFTVSVAGGVAGVTRVTFDGDLATGGAAELISGDKLIVEYVRL